jgi:pimeloyl-ACP methyl ester carboxylesterase
VGVTIFIIALVVESMLTGYSLTTRSSQRPLRRIVHIGALALFSLLVFVSVLEWSFRWVGFAALLLFWATRAVLDLLRTHGPERAYRTGPIVWRGIITLLLVFGSVLPAVIFPPYQRPATTGPYSIATVHYTYTDEDRIEPFTDTGQKRQVNVGCTYPQPGEDGAPYPLVIFSHGGLSTQSSNETLYLELASHGYVVCAIGHPYHAWWTTAMDGRITWISMDYTRELQQEDASRDKVQSYDYYQKWMKTRIGDINLVIDTILENAAEGVDGIYGRVDTGSIGVMGHSLGGSAVLGIGRQRRDVRAVIALESPFLADIIGVEDDAFLFIDEPYPIPVLNIYSDSSWEHLAQWPQYARNYALLSEPAPTVVNLHFGGAGHYSLTDLSLSSPLLVRLLEGDPPARDSREYLQRINQATLDFFNCHLKSEADCAR